MDIWCENAGVRLYAEAHGEGLPVVMLHGGMGTHHLSGAYVTGLGAGFQVLLPDVRGCGASVCRDPAAITWEVMADDVAALLDHVKAPRAIVGGVSGGSGCAAAFALRHPQRLAGLFLVQPVYAGAAQGYTPFQAGQFAPLAGLAARVAADGVSAFDPMFAANGMQAMAQAFLAVHDPQSVAAWGDFMARGDQPFATVDQLTRVTAPVLVIPGADDMHPRAIADQDRAALPHADWVEAPPADMAAVTAAIARFC
ncbi:MAG TPA: alpha/beta hydrolase, partial [Caulobacteraceae bacterium]|nr:alpha/beta hydrolase [Caulobacteraceae bacterium]